MRQELRHAHKRERSIFYRWLAHVALPSLGRRREECWLWTGAVHSGGYGILYDGRNGARGVELAHRLSHEFYLGPIPWTITVGGRKCTCDVAHACDNPTCVNPFHLRAMPHRSNLAEMRARERHPLCAPDVDWREYWKTGRIIRAKDHGAENIV